MWTRESLTEGWRGAPIVRFQRLAFKGLTNAPQSESPVRASALERLLLHSAREWRRYVKPPPSCWSGFLAHRIVFDPTRTT
jgi:hypothetical protein